MSKVNTEDLTGVTGASTTDILGNVVWYSIAKGLITPKELRSKLVASGLDESWMPKPIRVVDAFRRATNFKKKIQSDVANQFINYMVREVYADKEIAIRHLVAETVDQTGKRLDYNSEVGKIILNKKDGNLTVEHEEGNANAKFFVEEMAKNFDIFKGHYDAQAVRVMVADILKSLAPVSLRNNGGIYFVPVTFEEGVTHFTKFCESLNELSNGWKLPVVDTFEQRKMVAHTLLGNIRELHLDCTAALGKGLPKAKIKSLIEDIEKVSNDFKEYKALVAEEDAISIDKNIFEIRKLISQLLMEITN